MSAPLSVLSKLVWPIVWLGRNATMAVALSVFIGLLAQPLASFMKPLLVPAILLPFVVSLLRLDVRKLVSDMPLRLMLPVLIWQLFGAAIMVTAIIRLTPDIAPIGGFLITTAASAPLMASSAIAMLLGLNVGLAVAATVFATLLLPITLPPLVLFLAGLDIDLSASEIAIRLAFLIGVSVLIAALVRMSVARPTLDNHQDLLSGLAVLGLSVFAIAIMDGALDLFSQNPTFVIASAVFAFALNAGLQILTTAMFLPFVSINTALTVGLIAGNNNIGIVLASTSSHSSVEFAVYVAMAQFPIYILPALQKPLYHLLLSASNRPS